MQGSRRHKKINSESSENCMQGSTASREERSGSFQIISVSHTIGSKLFKFIKLLRDQTLWPLQEH